MKKHKISFELSTYNAIELLPLEEKNLMLKAVEARKKAYAPYSNFQVGAAVLLTNGTIVIGSNQENASYPSGLCAERVAIFQAGARFPNETIKAIAVSAASSTNEVATPAAPCGNCRQAMHEYEFRQKSPIAILMMGEKGDIHKCDAVADLLPLAFNNSFLE